MVHPIPFRQQDFQFLSGSISCLYPSHCLRSISCFFMVHCCDFVPFVLISFHDFYRFVSMDENNNSVWVAAVALFFHRWGKIRMLLPYQPVFKEEEPVIVGCSPSPTPLQLSQPSQLLPSSSLSQSQPPVPPSAVHVSANKFVSLDPAAIRRNQFMVSLPSFQVKAILSLALSESIRMLSASSRMPEPRLIDPAFNVQWHTIELNACLTKKNKSLYERYLTFFRAPWLISRSYALVASPPEKSATSASFSDCNKIISRVQQWRSLLLLLGSYSYFPLSSERSSNTKDIIADVDRSMNGKKISIRSSQQIPRIGPHTRHRTPQELFTWFKSFFASILRIWPIRYRLWRNFRHVISLPSSARKKKEIT